MNDCIFCRIVNKEIPASIVYEDEKVIAFNDIHPQAPVHILVVPKQHIESVMDINDDNKSIAADVHVAIVKVAEKSGIKDNGFRLISNCGHDAGQTVKHLHYHIIAGKTLGEKIL